MLGSQIHGGALGLGFGIKVCITGYIVTDPVAERAFLAKDDGAYPLTSAYLCVSLGEAYSDGFCYKLVATVISKDPL